MNGDWFENPLHEIEQQLEATRPPGAPRRLRAEVLAGVERELHAARRDYGLARAAAVLLVTGVGLNASLGLLGSRPYNRPSHQIASDRSNDSLIQTAIVVAEATDVETGRRFVRQLAAMSGRNLTGDEVAEIDAAVRSRTIGFANNGGDG